MDPDLARKGALRAGALAARAAVTDREGRAALIRSALADLIRNRFGGQPLAAYLAMRGEVDPLPALSDHGGPVGLPVVLAPATPLLFRRWTPGDPLEAGMFGTRHPTADAAPLVPRLVLIPLACFDRLGNRLGYGGGFYDRTLAGLRRQGPVAAIGVAFAAQQVEVIPVEATDEPLDGIVTEAGLTSFPSA